MISTDGEGAEVAVACCSRSVSTRSALPGWVTRTGGFIIGSMITARCNRSQSSRVTETC
jgi:hypothetical protein